MPRGGQNAKPVETRRREGGTKKRGAVSHRPVPDTLAVGGRVIDRKELRPPADLDDRGKQVWTELVALLHEAGMLDRVDLAAIRVAVVQYVQHDLALSVVAEPYDEAEDADLSKSLEEQAALLQAKRVRLSQALARDDSVSASEIDSLTKAELRLATFRDYVETRKKTGGLVALGSTGQLVEHPLVGTQRAAAALFLRFAEQFGATTLARTRIQLGKAAGRRIETDLEAELGRGRKRKAS